MELLLPLLAPPAAQVGAGDPIHWCLRDQQPSLEASGGSGPLPVAIASDAAFHFRYPEAGELLQAVGLEPLAWSPLADEPLPAGCRAVLLPGGYPELHAARLAASRRSLADLARAAAGGVPLVAECGGLLLLGEQLADGDGRLHRMAGVLPFQARKGGLSLGYRQATARAAGLLVRPGETFSGHEFHRWQLESVASGDGLWQLDGWGTATRSEGWTAPNVHASWLHLHWAGCPVIPSRLAAAAGRAVPLPMSAVSSGPMSPSP